MLKPEGGGGSAPTGGHEWPSSAAASHAAEPARALRVAPTTGDASNRLRAGLSPIACWQVEALRFRFASSFLDPRAARDLATLKSLRDRHSSGTGAAQLPALALFGHADPTGDDAVNKRLSGRRAAVVYGLLVRRSELWEEAYAAEEWGDAALKIMSITVGEEASEEALARLRSDPAARERLFRAYMDAICLDAQGHSFRLEASDFLGGGEDADGRADYQGCGEFNPVLRLSAEEVERFSDEALRDERDRHNAPNRRVSALLFRPGVRVDPGRWPCPAASAPEGGCRKRFWADHERRREVGEERREFRSSEDTFACRFYQRLSTNSPCERRALALGPEFWSVRIQVDEDLEGVDAIRIEAQDGSHREELPVAWGVPDGDFIEYRFDPGPSGKYDVFVVDEDDEYMVWAGLTLPNDEHGAQLSEFVHDDEEEDSTLHMDGPDGDSSDATTVVVNGCCD